MAARQINVAQEQRLLTDILDPRIANDPRSFVRYVYPWGKAGGPLDGHPGPKNWQDETLVEIGEHVRKQDKRVDLGLIPEIYRAATCSGRGIGKSALVGMVCHWMRSTVLGSTTLVSANSEPQLANTTFPEIRKWTTMASNGHWFETAATSVRPVKWFRSMIEDQMKINTAYYYTEAKLWSEENPDSYTGPHSSIGMLLIFDEASGIHKGIFKAADGFFTEPTARRFHLCWSNGRRNSGGFYDLFEDPETRKLWRTRHIDARTVERSDLKIYENIISQYGADSDEARIEVYGLFPKFGTTQFISVQSVRDAQRREVMYDPGAPLIMGVDVAPRGGMTVARFRHGRDGRVIPPQRTQMRDNVPLANWVANLILRYRPDAVNIDAGNGTGVIDILRQQKFRINEVWFGSTPNDRQWADKRIEMYALARDWLDGGALDSSIELEKGLTAPEMKRSGKSGDKLRLESKDELYARGVKGFDDADAFVLTFARNIARIDYGARGMVRQDRRARDVDYPIFGD